MFDLETVMCLDANKLRFYLNYWPENHQEYIQLQRIMLIKHLACLLPCGNENLAVILQYAIDLLSFGSTDHELTAACDIIFLIFEKNVDLKEEVQKVNTKYALLKISLSRVFKTTFHGSNSTPIEDDKRMLQFQIRNHPRNKCSDENIYNDVLRKLRSSDTVQEACITIYANILKKPIGYK